MASVIPQVNSKPASELKRAAEQKKIYEEKLVGKRFIYLYLDGSAILTHKEMMFKRENYLHLVGLDYQNRQSLKRTNNLSVGTNSLEFYDRLGNDNTLINDVSFITGATTEDTNRYYRYTQHKLDNLSQLTAITNKAEYIGKGKNGFDVIINRSKCSIAFAQEDNIYYPVSSMFGAAKDIATNIKPIAAIFSKSEERRDFQLEYLNAKMKCDKAYFERELMDKLSLSSFENPQVKFNSGKLEEIKRTFQLSEAKYISQDLSEISQLRKAAFENEEALNAYISKCKVFRNGLDTERKTDTVANILKKQLENETDSEVKKLINEELNELKYQQSMSTAAPYVMKCEFKPLPENISHGEAAVITAEPTSPNGLFGKIKDALKNLLTKKTDRPQEKADNEAPEDIYTESYFFDFTLPPKQQHRREQESNDTFPQKEVTANKISLDELKVYARQVRMEREREPKKEIDRSENSRNDHSDMSL